MGAYEAYIKGRYYYLNFLGGGMEKALQYYEQAITLDPSYAPAYSAIAEYYWFLSLYGQDASKDDLYTKAREAVNTALKIDKNLPDAHATLGLIKFYFDWDWKRAEKAFKTAISLNPGLSKSHYDYAIFLLVVGDTDSAIFMARKAVELDPLYGIPHFILGFCLSHSGQLDEALRELKQAREMMPSLVTVLAVLAYIYYSKGLFEDALSEINKGLELFPGHPYLLCIIGHINVLRGEKEKTRDILDELLERSKEEDVSPIFIAWLYADLGEIDYALKYFDDAYEKRDIYFVYIKIIIQKYLDVDTRFNDYIKKIGL